MLAPHRISNFSDYKLRESLPEIINIYCEFQKNAHICMTTNMYILQTAHSRVGTNLYVKVLQLFDLLGIRFF